MGHQYIFSSGYFFSTYQDRLKVVLSLQVEINILEHSVLIELSLWYSLRPFAYKKKNIKVKQKLTHYKKFDWIKQTFPIEYSLQ